MGKHFWVKNLDDESQVKQPGCMWGLVHVLDYHQWQSNVRKMIHHRNRRYHRGQTHDHCVSGYEKLLEHEQESESPLHVHAHKKKRSLRARIKAMYTEEASGEAKDARGKGGGHGFSSSSLQRTYSIHHLQSVDGFFGKIRTDCPIIFLPTNSDNLNTTRGESHSHLHSPKEKPADVFEIFKVDKEFLLKHLHDSDESIANFSRTAFGLTTKPKFSKSRSFPVATLAQRRKQLKPLKLESKYKEVWSDKLHHSLDGSVNFGTRSGELATDEGIMNEQDRQRNGDVADKSQPLDSDRICEKKDDDGIRKLTHRRSSSLNESLDKYARLFENSFGKDVKLSSSQSLRLTSEYGYAPLSFKRKHSLSNADSYYSEVFGEINPSGSSLVVIAEDHSSSGLQNSEEEEEEEETMPSTENMELIKEDDASDNICQNEDSFEDKGDQLKGSEKDIVEEVQDQSFVSDSEIFLHSTESPAVELHAPKGKEHESRIDMLDSSVETDDLQSIRGKHLSTRHPHKKNPDLDYVRQLLDKSGIAIDACDMPWHASDQLFGPQLFEEVEAGWPHEEDQLDGLPDFQGCWHHQMLFDLVNEVLLDVYDISLPYYPKALSSSCQVRPFPMGDRVIEEVCTSIGTLIDIKPEEKESLDCIVGRDLFHDRRWMNLQLESESITIYLEDMIFDELLQEVIFS